MKLTKNFCWDTFRTAAMNRESSFYNDGYMYDIIYIADSYMLDNKRRPYKEDITTEQDKHIANMPDGTPLFFKDGQYKLLGKE
tara:strand:- start:781 stop:1029 length:249 start_codon:yes stop_codon:yes gene_type:complete